MMSSCVASSGFSGSGNYWYICNHENDKCLASSPSNDRVYMKSLNLHWEEQQHFVWKVTKSSNEYKIESVGKSGGSRKYMSTNSDGDYVDLWKTVGDRQRWNIEHKKYDRDTHSEYYGYYLYHIYNEDLYYDPISCELNSACGPAHLYANGNDADLKYAKDSDDEFWYFIQVNPYHNLGTDPSSTSMTQCQGDCDADSDCANGYDCYERHYSKCGADCEMPKECFIKEGDTANAGKWALDPCVSNTVPVILPFEAPQPGPSDGGKYYFVFDSNWVAAVVVVLAVVNVVVILLWCTRRRRNQTKKVVYKMVDIESETEDLK